MPIPLCVWAVLGLVRSRWSHAAVYPPSPESYPGCAPEVWFAVQGV